MSNSWERPDVIREYGTDLGLLKQDLALLTDGLSWTLEVNFDEAMFVMKCHGREVFRRRAQRSWGKMPANVRSGILVSWIAQAALESRKRPASRKRAV